MATHIAIEGAAGPRAAPPQRGAETSAEDSAFASLLGQAGAQDHQAGRPDGDGGRETAGAPASHADANAPRAGEDPQIPGELRPTARHHGERTTPLGNPAQGLTLLADQIENAAGVRSAQADIAAIPAQQMQAVVASQQAAAQHAGEQTPPPKPDEIASRIASETAEGRPARQGAAPILTQGGATGRLATSSTGGDSTSVAGQNDAILDGARLVSAGHAAGKAATARSAAQENASRGQQHGDMDPALLRQGTRDHAAAEGRPEPRNTIIERLAEQNGQPTERLSLSSASREAGTQLPQGANAGAKQAEAAGRHAGPAPSPVSTGGDHVVQSSSQNLDPLLQGATGSGSSTQEAEAANRPANSQPQGRPVPAHLVHEQVAIQIQRAAADGQQRMTIRLHPAELGRIEVKLDLAADGSVRALLAVDRAETLDLIQRDVRGLEKALNDAGLKTDNGSLSFDLRGEDGGDESPDSDRGFGEATALTAQEAESEGAPTHGSASAEPRQLIWADGIDIRI